MPRFKKCYVLLLIWLAYCCGQASFAQIIDRNNKDKWKEPVPDKVDPRPLYFKNINRIAYFYDKERIERIKKLTRKDGSLMELYDALHKYVMNFGVKNFRKDWKLIAKQVQDG
jgi:hypothetical protein